MTAMEFPHPKDKLILLKRLPVFSGCTERQLLLIAERTRLVEYKKGEIVYCEGAEANAFYIVVSGRLRIVTGKESGRKTISVLHNGDSFGEISLLTGERHSASVEGLNDTLVLELAKKDFEDVINKIPTLVLHLSRLLSRRLRVKESLGEYTEATIVSVYSPADRVGKTFFAIALTATLKRDTPHEAILVDTSIDHPEQQRYAAGLKPSAKRLAGIPGLLPEKDLNRRLYDHPLGFGVLRVGDLLEASGGERAIAPLFSLLTKRFRYIVIDLPTKVDDQVIKALSQSDLIYLVTDQHRDNVTRTKVFLRRMEDLWETGDQRLKVIVNRMVGIGWPVSVSEIAEELGRPVSFVLPEASAGNRPITPDALSALLETQDSAYAIAVRRISRELSGSVVGLALGSGAALGLAHIGVIKVLEREKIPIDIIAGSSIGALIGGLWASGVSAADLEKMALRFKSPWHIFRLFILDIRLPGFVVVLGLIVAALSGLWMHSWWAFVMGFLGCLPFGMVLGALSGGPIQGAELMRMLERDFAGRAFEDTRIPLKIVAAKPMTRDEIVFESGSIAEAVRASVSIPGIFKPVRRQGRICLDGGVVNPVPVSVLKDAGANRIIAVNVFPSSAELLVSRHAHQKRRDQREAELATRSFPIRFFSWIKQEVTRSVSPLIFDVIMRSMQSMEHQIAAISCEQADLTLQAAVPDSHWLEFYRPEKFIKRGEEAALERLVELKRLTGSQDQTVDKP